MSTRLLPAFDFPKGNALSVPPYHMLRTSIENADADPEVLARRTEWLLEALNVVASTGRAQLQEVLRSGAYMYRVTDGLAVCAWPKNKISPGLVLGQRISEGVHIVRYAVQGATVSLTTQLATHGETTRDALQVGRDTGIAFPLPVVGTLSFIFQRLLESVPSKSHLDALKALAA